jgi:SNF2 family DNA or RNA helicase
MNGCGQKTGLVKFLRPDWVGNAKVVLTTYETLRDLEFSFAAQKWSLMVCDEAQRIKNPAAMVTRAAKKQNVAFKIACTGTPVENTLADIWCLFDYVQPACWEH